MGRDDAAHHTSVRRPWFPGGSALPMGAVLPVAAVGPGPVGEPPRHLFSGQVVPSGGRADGEEAVGMVERERLRVSDSERQVAVDRLRMAHDEGRLDLDEYDRRLAAAYGSVTYADLDQLFTDLPGPRTDPRPMYGRPFPAGAYPPPQVAPYGFGSMSGPPAYAQPAGPIGQVRSTGLQVLLFIVTFGIWSFVYFFQTHEEMKRHSGEGIGGGLALVVNCFLGIVSPFLLSHEVGAQYERRGQRSPVTALTGLWFFPGIFLLVGPLIWFIRTNDALNDYWRSLGAR